MLAFQVQVNDEAPILAGRPTETVLTLIASYVSARGELDLSVGGLSKSEGTRSERIDWLQRDLKIGDRVTLVVVESDHISAPISVRVDDPQFIEREKRRYYERLKAEYEKDGSAPGPR